METSQAPICYCLNFHETKDGALNVIQWTPFTGEEKNYTWSEFVSDEMNLTHLKRIYGRIKATTPFLLEKRDWGTNLTTERMLWQLRRFVSKWCAQDISDSWNWIEKTDGTLELNLDELSCSQGCPVIKQAIMYLKQLQFSTQDFSENKHSQNFNVKLSIQG